MSERRSIPPMIPAWLDDMRLTTVQFRVYCHLSRRAGKDGKCFPKKETILKICRISEPTLLTALNELEAIGLVVREYRLGTSNIYRVANEPPPIGRKCGTGIIKGAAPITEGRESPKSEGWESPKNEGCKGSPPEGSPPKEVPKFASNSAPNGTVLIATNQRWLSLDESVSLAAELHEKARYDADSLFGMFPPEEIRQWAEDWFHKLESDGWLWKGSDVHNPKANLTAWLRGCARNQSKRFKELARSNKDGEEPPF